MVNIVEANEIPLQGLTATFSEYSRLKKLVDDLTARQKLLKESLMQSLEIEGFEDEKGHQWIELEQEVDGYVSIQRQRRVSNKLDEKVAEELLNSKGLASRCYKLVPVLDEQAIMAAHYEGLLSESDIDTMFPQTVTFAFVPSKK